MTSPRRPRPSAFAVSGAILLLSATAIAQAPTIPPATSTPGGAPIDPPPSPPASSPAILPVPPIATSPPSLPFPLLAPPAPLRAPAWQPGQPAPPGMRIRYTVNATEAIIGGSILALSYSITTLIESATVYASGGVVGGALAPLGAQPILGAPNLALFLAADKGGDGTIAAVLGLMVAQGLGFGILMHSIAHRRPAGIVPDCDPKTSSFVLSPLVAPGAGGLTLRGSL